MKVTLGTLAFWKLLIAGLLAFGPTRWWSSTSAQTIYGYDARWVWTFLFGVLGAALLWGMRSPTVARVALAWGAVLWGSLGALILGFVVLTRSPASPVGVVIFFVLATFHLGLIVVMAEVAEGAGGGRIADPDTAAATVAALNVLGRVDNHEPAPSTEHPGVD